MRNECVSSAWRAREEITEVGLGAVGRHWEIAGFEE